ncbi:aldo/keto reductase [Chitinophaga polysaccharea]|uniref:aldo/keto reductase n=1 Tax=Chitinophaga polysaccharea TaxID=1293035 RepID=UPI0011591AAB|nr:aldo/keto reductase [Chitinophaga polysaccharea]
MKYKIFGANSGLYASELILGGAMFGATGYGAGKEEAKSILACYADAGGNFIDTADVYKYGASEEVIGEFIAANRNDFIISSKFTRSASAAPAITALGNNRKAMIRSAEDSLRRLKTDRIDIYIAHFDDNITPAEELVRGFDDLLRAGKILYAGLSNFPAWKVATAVTIANTHLKAPVIALQTEYSLVQRVPEKELLPMANNFGLGVMAYSPLAGGLLTGKYRNNEAGRITLTKNDTLIQNQRNNAILDTIITIANETGSTPANVAVAWICSKGIFPVIGPRTKAQLDEYLASQQLHLTKEQIALLDQASEIPLEYPHDLTKTQRELMMQHLMQ